MIHKCVFKACESAMFSQPLKSDKNMVVVSEGVKTDGLYYHRFSAPLRNEWSCTPSPGKGKTLNNSSLGPWLGGGGAPKAPGRRLDGSAGGPSPRDWSPPGPGAGHGAQGRGTGWGGHPVPSHRHRGLWSPAPAHARTRVSGPSRRPATPSGPRLGRRPPRTTWCPTSPTTQNQADATEPPLGQTRPSIPCKHELNSICFPNPLIHFLMISQQLCL